MCTSFPLAEAFFGIRSEVFTRSLDSSLSFLVSSFLKKKMEVELIYNFALISGVQHSAYIFDAAV